MTYDILYKTFIVSKPLCITFDKIDEYFRIYNETRYLVLLGPEKYDTICNETRYLVNQKRRHHINVLSILRKNNNWFFAYRKNLDFA